MKLVIDIEGLERDALQRGLSAAMKVFTDKGISPYDAQQGYFAMLGWDEAGFPQDGDFALSEQEAKESDTWLEATEAAIDAACHDWPLEKRIQISEPLSIEMSAAERAQLGD